MVTIWYTLYHFKGALFEAQTSPRLLKYKHNLDNRIFILRYWWNMVSFNILLRKATLIFFYVYPRARITGDDLIASINSKLDSEIFKKCFSPDLGVVVENTHTDHN